MDNQEAIDALIGADEDDDLYACEECGGRLFYVTDCFCFIECAECGDSVEIRDPFPDIPGPDN